MVLSWKSTVGIRGHCFGNYCSYQIYMGLLQMQLWYSCQLMSVDGYQIVMIELFISRIKNNDKVLKLQNTLILMDDSCPQLQGRHGRFLAGKTPQWHPHHWHAATAAAGLYLEKSKQDLARPRSCQSFLLWQP